MKTRMIPGKRIYSRHYTTPEATKRYIEELGKAKVGKVEENKRPKSKEKKFWIFGKRT